MRPRLIITNHAIRRWQQRIDDVPTDAAMLDMLAALATAKSKHFATFKLKKQTFYIPTGRAMFIGSRGKIVTVVQRDEQDRYGGKSD